MLSASCSPSATISAGVVMTELSAPEVLAFAVPSAIVHPLFSQPAGIWLSSKLTSIFVLSMTCPLSANVNSSKPSALNDRVPLCAPAPSIASVSTAVLLAATESDVPTSAVPCFRVKPVGTVMAVMLSAPVPSFLMLMVLVPFSTMPKSIFAPVADSVTSSPRKKAIFG